MMTDTALLSLQSALGIMTLTWGLLAACVLLFVHGASEAKPRAWSYAPLERGRHDPADRYCR